jgi:tetratricopeptide (TPR) repeat protein
MLSPFGLTLALFASRFPSAPPAAPPGLDCPAPAGDAERAAAYRRFAAGQKGLLSGEVEAAVEALREAVRQDPLGAVSHYALGQAYLAAKRYPEAVTSFAACRDAFLCLAEEAPADGEAAARRRQREIAELRQTIRGLERDRLVESAMKWREMNRDAPPTLGKSQQLIHELERRLADLEAGRAARGPVPSAVFQALGHAQFLAGALPAAERAYRAALEVDPRSGDAHNDLAVILMLTGRLEEARREVERAESAGVKVSPRLKEEIRRLGR